jgi:DNA-binding Lrp family transcriptional regulator
MRNVSIVDTGKNAGGDTVTKAYVLLKVKPGYERNIVKELKEQPEIEIINELYGEWDIITMVSVAGIDKLDELISDKMRRIEGISITSTMIVADYKY